MISLELLFSDRAPTDDALFYACLVQEQADEVLLAVLAVPNGQLVDEAAQDVHRHVALEDTRHLQLEVHVDILPDLADPPEGAYVDAVSDVLGHVDALSGPRWGSEKSLRICMTTWQSSLTRPPKTSSKWLSNSITAPLSPQVEQLIAGTSLLGFRHVTPLAARPMPLRGRHVQECPADTEERHNVVPKFQQHQRSARARLMETRSDN